MSLVGVGVARKWSMEGLEVGRSRGAILEFWETRLGAMLEDSFGGHVGSRGVKCWVKVREQGYECGPMGLGWSRGFM